ncbi:hypothetical protein WJX74_006394 [Apatococcus lobatus]|uniref:Uncharacterized protein n=1 Tax=Apatococcus lobatus TaxID=904363 RepID=A0AAW1R112_9CHLO
MLVDKAGVQALVRREAVDDVEEHELLLLAAKSPELWEGLLEDEVLAVLRLALETDPGTRTPLFMLPSWMPCWIQLLLDLVMPTVPAMNSSGLQPLEKRMDYPIVTPEARQLAEDCSFLILVDKAEVVSEDTKKRAKKLVPSGMGFFYGPKTALSCAHSLPEDVLQPGAMVQAVEKELEWVRLTGQIQHAYMPVFSGTATELVGARLGLCSFHVNLTRQLDEPLSSLGIMPEHGIHVSHNACHLLYHCPCWPGDSGAAVILYKGQVAAMHQEGVNHVRELIRHKQDAGNGPNARLDALAASFQSIVDSTSQGALALTASHFPELRNDAARVALCDQVSFGEVLLSGSCKHI